MFDIRLLTMTESTWKILSLDLAPLCWQLICPCYTLLLVVLGLSAIVYIMPSCVSAVVLRSVLSSNNEVDDLI